MSSSLDVIAIGEDMVVNRDEFRFAYVRANDKEGTFSVIMVFDGDPEGGLSFVHPDGTNVTLDEARTVLDEFHQALTLP